MKQLWEWGLKKLHEHNVDLLKDILIPAFSIDKIAVVIGLYFAIKSFRLNAKIAKVSFIHQLTQSHRDIWIRIANDTNLQQIDNPSADPDNVSLEQEKYVVFVLLNTNVAFDAHKEKVYLFSKQAQIDTGEFFNLPIPNAVWNSVKKYYDDDFVEFIENAKEIAQGKPIIKKVINGKFVFLKLILVQPILIPIKFINKEIQKKKKIRIRK
jgi:hypothetical protein